MDSAFTGIQRRVEVFPQSPAECAIRSPDFAVVRDELLRKKQSDESLCNQTTKYQRSGQKTQIFYNADSNMGNVS